MKKVLFIILVFMLCLSLFACSNKKNDMSDTSSTSEMSYTNDTSAESEEPEVEDIPESKLGNSIESDILRITLVNAKFAIKLNSSSSGTLSQIQSGQTTLSDKYFTPEEYDPKKDAGKAYIAAKGHTYVAIEFKAENLDRTSVEFDGSFNGQFMTVEYGGNTYNEKTNYGCESSNGYQWVKYNSINVMLLAGKEAFYRCYIDIPVDVENLDDDFGLIFALPNSKGSVSKFKYVVTATDRSEVESQEISVDEAINVFTTEEGQTYFTKHMEEYTVLSGADINSLIYGRKMNILIKYSNGSWKGAFKFEADGRIQETHPLIGVGYFNKRTWSISGDTLIITGKDVCQVRKVKDGAYLLVKDNAPYAILY